MIPNAFVEHAAATQHISLRTGCMCNSGGAAAILGFDDNLRMVSPGITRKGFEQLVGREVGVVRVSLGLASSFKDAWRILQFAAMIGHQKSRERLWDSWIASSGAGHGHAPL